MCGILGFFGGASALPTNEALHVLRRMGDAIAHRGPDGDGYWYDIHDRLGMAHRRLAVVDLTTSGAQPMKSGSGRYTLVFNGEIYNHRELRERLSTDWRGTSDTETLLAGFDTWGLGRTVEAAVGMFAFAVWDRTERRLTLGRDRLGEKPLYYGWQGTSIGHVPTFLFASDLAALRVHPAFDGDISRDAIHAFMRYSNIGGTASIYRGISKLPAGCLLTLSENDPIPQPISYWSGIDVALEGQRAPFIGTPEEATDLLESIIKDTIKNQMVADVPLGAFLSGGVDSSVVAALMQVQSERPIRTFSIGFREAAFDESSHARAVAAHLKTKHTEIFVGPQDALRLIPLLPTVYSEPFADSSQIPTFLLSRLTREHVTVALSGDGGDELFCGYNRYQITARTWHWLSKLPPALRSGIARLLLSASQETWNRIGNIVGIRRWAHFGEKLHKGARALTSADTSDLYLNLISQWADSDELVVGGGSTPPLPVAALNRLAILGGVDQMMALDMLTYLTDDILVKVDRAAMGASLEVRAPFLDHRVVKFAWSLPLEYKLRNGATKWPLRQLLYRHVPRELIERPKMGFGVPIDSWLRGPLKDWAEALLDEGRLRREGYLKPAPIRAKWAEHLSGKRNWQYHLWNVLMFQAWLEGQRG